MKKYLSLGSAAALALALAACGSTSPTDTPSAPADNTPDAEVVTRPTSRRGDTAEALVEGMSPEGAWVFGFGSDITVNGPLNIEGEIEKHSGGEWTGEHVRKLGLYQRDADRNPIGAFNLTVSEGIVVDSPNTMFLAEGDYTSDINADVLVNSENFRLENVHINGDLTFGSEAAMNSATAAIWNANTESFEDVPLSQVVSGTVKVAQ